MTQSGFLAGAAIVALCGALFDIRSARIPNFLTYSAMASALVCRFAFLGWRGLVDGTAGLLIAGGVFFLLFVIRAMGGGDVKLMAAVGAWVGLPNVGRALIASALCGGLMAVGYMIFLKRFRSTLSNVVSLIRFHAVMGAEPHPEINLANPSAVRMPYGVAIALGSLSLLLPGIWKG
ncbi:A24 family peptidase [Edaphobacter bradus]|uniref:A24 family peptidase n=1 Tax=Edaphobacter bradus TaxID=2259016 RepID=UPI00295A9B96|nr:A24 family peptidase [Edaphobacter bradus]